MSADIERLAREFKGDKYKHLRASLNANAQIARQLGAPEHFDNGQTATTAEKPSPLSKEFTLSRIEDIARVCSDQLNTPEILNQAFNEIWDLRGQLIGVVLEVTPCPLTQEELSGRKERGISVGYLPKELATQQDRHKLGEMFPKMQSQSVQEGNSVTNDESPSGWFDYEAAIDAPYLDTKEGQLMDRLKKDERQILTLNQYIVAGQDSKLFTGKYLDETRTYVRLGSRYGGRVVRAYFGPHGRLHVGSLLRPGDHDPGFGGRSSGVKKA